MSYSPALYIHHTSQIAEGSVPGDDHVIMLLFIILAFAIGVFAGKEGDDPK